MARTGELALIVGVEEFQWMFWISQKEVSTAHPSALKAEVGITILKPSDTRSFNRGKKPTTLTGELMLIKGKDINKYFKNII